MRKLFTIVFMLIMAFSATSCGSSQQPEQTGAGEPDGTEANQPDGTGSNQPDESKPEETPTEPTSGDEQVELIVFAAASMTETLEEISDLYGQVKPDVKLTFNFDSSGTLKTQIQEGAECDLFISAGQKQMDQLDITAPEDVNTEKLDFVVESTRTDLLENKVTLVVPEGNPKNINSFQDMASALSGGGILMAMGNSDVPVGQYTQKILTFFNLNEEELAAAGKISYGTNVKEVTVQVEEAAVDCGVVYCTDAFSAKLNIVDYATAEMCGRVIYPAAVLNTSEKQEAAGDFLEYLASAEAMAVFEKVGFSKP